MFPSGSPRANTETEQSSMAVPWSQGIGPQPMVPLCPALPSSPAWLSHGPEAQDSSLYCPSDQPYPAALQGCPMAPRHRIPAYGALMPSPAQAADTWHCSSYTYSTALFSEDSNNGHINFPLKHLAHKIIYQSLKLGYVFLNTYPFTSKCIYKVLWTNGSVGFSFLVN